MPEKVAIIATECKSRVAILETDRCSAPRYGSDMSRLEIVRWMRAAMDHAGMSQTALAEAMTRRLRRNIDKAAVNEMLIEKPKRNQKVRAVKADEMIAIAEITGYPRPGGEHLSSEEVAAGMDGEVVNLDPTAGEVTTPFPDAIPQMAGRMGAGSTGEVIALNAGTMSTIEPVTDWWRIPPSVLRGLTGTDPASVRVFPMDGDSMEPAILRTDIVFIDVRRQRVEPDGIWAVDYGLGRTLKRILVKGRGQNLRLVLRSDNQKYSDDEFSPDEVTIFGRYIGRFSVF